jgi:hypothetical protein
MKTEYSMNARREELATFLFENQFLPSGGISSLIAKLTDPSESSGRASVCLLSFPPASLRNYRHMRYRVIVDRVDGSIQVNAMDTTSHKYGRLVI